MPVPPEIQTLIDEGALIALNHSGGKDSQACMIELLRLGVPMDQMIIIHASLGDIEWPGTIDHIKETTHGLPLIIAKARRSFFEMVRARGMFPSPKYRQCTSDQKRGPIERELRRFLKRNPQFKGKVINVMGMRAEESATRAKQPRFKRIERNSVAGRDWYNWLPIHDMTHEDVFTSIRRAGEEPHWAYDAGMSRLSCSFCIMSSLSDLKCAAKLRPDLLAEYAALEDEIAHTLRPDGVTLRATLERVAETTR